MKKIIFVCTGNTCRSPMAAAFFNAYAAKELPDFYFTAASAGLVVPSEAPPSDNALLVMKASWSIDISKHRAHALSQADIDDASLILAMTVGHKQRILSMFPEAHQKVFTLKEYAYGNHGKSHECNVHAAAADIADPFGGSPETYMLCAEEIRHAVERLIEKLKKS